MNQMYCNCTEPIRGEVMTDTCMRCLLPIFRMGTVEQMGGAGDSIEEL